jgi:hypothetical protein
MTEQERAKADDIHITPMFGLPHRESSLCWCRPRLDYADAQTGRQVWVHEPSN